MTKKLFISAIVKIAAVEITRFNTDYFRHIRVKSLANTRVLASPFALI